MWASIHFSLLPTLHHDRRQADPDEMPASFAKTQVENTILIAKAKLRQRERRRKKIVSTPKKRTIWFRKWLTRRPDLGQYARLMDKLKKEDVKGFRNFLRMDYEIYQEILTRIEHRINPKKSMYRKPLTAGIKLAITLRYLASGDSYHSLMYGFRVAHNTISKVIRQVCDAIVAEFAEEVIPCPQTPKEWKNIANQFRDRWQLHNCVVPWTGSTSLYSVLRVGARCTTTTRGTIP